MKKVTTKNRVAIIALVAAISTAFVNPLMASTKTDPPAVEVKYIGLKDNNPVFEVAINTKKTDNYYVSVKDEAGEILYSEKLQGTTLSRKYRIDTEEEIKAGGLIFEIWSANTNKTEIFTVGVTETIKRDVAVNKIQ